LEGAWHPSTATCDVLTFPASPCSSMYFHAHPLHLICPSHPPDVTT
jgi:hypothetical protein